MFLVSAQVHALNILRALFRDTRQGENVMPFVADGVQAAVLGFTSPVWAVSLHLLLKLHSPRLDTFTLTCTLQISRQVVETPIGWSPRKARESMVCRIFTGINIVHIIRH